MATGKNRQVEVRLVAEYLKATYPQYTFITKQPLGKVSEELMAAEGYQRAMGLSRAFRPEVDAVVILPGALVLLEAKVWSVVNGLAKLPVYKSLVPFTPELKQYSHLPIIMELVVGWTNTNLEIMAREMGVRIRIYCPDWMNEVQEKLHKYWTREYVEAREDKLKLRAYYGIE
jgi:hypothetical protein